MRKDAPAHQDLLPIQQKPIGSSQLQILPPRGLTSDNDPSSDVECTGAELSHPALGSPQTLDLQTCYICQGTSNQESIMICDGQGCSVIAHLNCYFSAGSQDATDAITDIEHWHCEHCGAQVSQLALRALPVPCVRICATSTVAPCRRNWHC